MSEVVYVRTDCGQKRRNIVVRIREDIPIHSISAFRLVCPVCAKYRIDAMICGRNVKYAMKSGSWIRRCASINRYQSSQWKPIDESIATNCASRSGIAKVAAR